MKHVSTHTVCLSIVIIAGFAQACSSDKALPTATGGAASTGGASNASGGASPGGASSSGGKAPVSSGGAIGQDCTASSTLLAPTDGLIASFADVDGGIDFAGGKLLEYPFDATAPKATAVGGSLRITQNTPATSSAQYTGVAIGFGRCIDASAFTGVQFTISGSFSGCVMKYLSGDVAHQDATSGAPYATGAAGAYQPQSPIAGSQLTSAPLTLWMPFDAPQYAGNPSTPLDPGKIILVGWQFEIAASATASNCVVDITLDNIKFY